MLYNDPMAIVGDDEAVNVELETVLDRGVVDFGDDFARAAPSNPPFSYETSSCGVLYGNPKLVLEWREPAPSAPITLVAAITAPNATLLVASSPSPNLNAPEAMGATQFS